VWNWPLISNYCQGQENEAVYIQSSICLHSVVLNLLSTGATLLIPVVLWGCEFLPLEKNID
jgi:hypothetical protein